MTNMGGSSKEGRGLLRVELDDELLAHGHVDVGAQWQVANGHLLAAVAGVHPGRDLAIERVDVLADGDHVLALVRQRDHVAPADLVARDRHPAAVDLDVAMAHELAGLGSARAPAGAEGDVVQPGLEEAQQVLAGHALLAVGLGIEVGELLLEQAVDAAGLLLLAQLGQVLRTLLAARPAVITGRVGPPLDRALHGVALGALQVQLHALPAAELAYRSRVTSHLVRPSDAWAGGNRCAAPA